MFAWRWGALVVLLVAIALAGAVSPAANSFDGKIKNDSISFLPGSAESVQVAQQLKRFPGGELVPAVVVYRRDGGLTAQDRARIAAVRGEWLTPGAVSGVRPATPVVASADGTTEVFTVPLRATGDAKRITDLVDRLRVQTKRDLPAGLKSAVTGPAGYSADAIKVFANINTKLFFSAGGLVMVLLLVIYRSPIFWILPIFSVVLAEHFVRAAGSLAIDAGLSINGQTQGILLVLVFGAGTDYALLLVARTREELHRTTDRRRAVSEALRRSGPPILASAGTVIAGLLVLSFAEVNGTAGLGPAGAMGVALAAIGMLAVLPALLVLAPRWVFWPRIPQVDHMSAEEPAVRGVWRRLGEATARRSRVVWVLVTVVLLLMATGLTRLHSDLTSANGFIGGIEAVDGQNLLGRAFPAGVTAPTTLLVPPGGNVTAAVAAARATPGVAAVLAPTTGTPGTQVTVVLASDPYTLTAYAVIPRLRHAVAAAAPGSRIGGPTATEVDVRAASRRDSWRLPPAILAVVFVILAVLLRALLVPALLTAAVILSFLAALGASAVVFDIVGAPGEGPTLPLYGFVFLVALGVDYSIFLMARAREESERHGTREGTLRALAVTGGVITSAGIVLAGTFAVLGVLPLWALFEVGFLVAFGVLVDALVVRTLLVPALVHDIGARVWWPSALARAPRHPPEESPTPG